MSTEELIKELADINSIFVNEINTKLSNLLEKLNSSKYDKVYSELLQFKKLNSHLLTRIM